MLDIDVSADFREVERMVNHMPGLIEKAAVRSLNRTNDQVATIGRRLIAKKMGISVKAVRAGMFKIKAIRQRLDAATIASGKPLNLIRFKSRQTKRGISANAWGKRKLYKGAFIGNQGRTIFKRTSSKRLPIKPVWGPSIPVTMVQDAIIKAMARHARNQWQKNFARDMQFYLDRARFK